MADRSFIYGYRLDHSRKAGTAFLAVAALAAIVAFLPIGTAGRVLMGFMLVFFVWMGVSMLVWNRDRKRGTHTITVGNDVLRTPRTPLLPIQYREIPYARMKSVSIAAGPVPKLVIDGPDEKILIAQNHLGSDEEFAQLVAAVQERYKAAMIDLGRSN